MRSSIARDRRWLSLSWLGLIGLLALLAAYGGDAGVSYDEVSQRQYGELILAWYRSGFEDTRATHFFDLFLYGGLFDALAQIVVSFSPLDPFGTRHLLTALTALLGIVATWQLANRVAGPRAALVAAALLALTPCWIGHGLFNPKDIPFGTAMAFASLTALRLAYGPARLRVRDMCLAGAAAGAALAIRPGGVFVLGYPCLAAAGRLGVEALRRRRSGQPLQLGSLAARLVLCALLVVLIAWAVMLSAWPWAQLDPLHRPFEAMRTARSFHWGGYVRFEGQMIKAGELPLRYLPVWFRRTLPETYLLGALAGAALCVRLALRRAFRAEQVLGAGLLAVCALLPFAAVLITRPVLYDAQRHMLFLLPPAAALCGCALSELLAAGWIPRALRGAMAGVAAGVALLICVDIVQLHPYEYVYFNRLSGGLRKNYKRFDTDYWSISYREAFDWVVRELPPVHPARRTRVSSCDVAGNERLEYYRNLWPGAADRIRVVSSYEKADVFLAVRRFDCHRVKGDVLYKVKRQGVPLLYVRRTQR